MKAVGVEGDSGDTLTDIIKATRKRGNVALIGDFFFTTNNFPIGALMEKGITYIQKLLELVLTGKYDPSWMFTAEDRLENVGECYDKFFSHEIPGGLKVVLKTEYGRQLEAAGRYA
ncbi:unnamed protein product [Parascedosporium putredinis]|nr:unnamed protein product [Parascedosporium putredinis]CAI8004059.1 unnamed protein product [Parascedosporium putredinis]